MKPGEYPWRAVVRLKFPGRGFSRKIGFRYEWKAWLLACDALGVDLDKLSELDPDTQITAVHYGAAMWERFTHRKSVYFTLEDMRIALSKASKEDNILLANTMAEAQFPEWMSNLPEGKKKAKKS